MTRRAVRGRLGEKGGSNTAAAISPEAADHRLERGDLVAEAKGDRFERLALNEHGADLASHVDDILLLVRDIYLPYEYWNCEASNRRQGLDGGQVALVCAIDGH